jgi:hypothetical protein
MQLDGTSLNQRGTAAGSSITCVIHRRTRESARWEEADGQGSHDHITSRAIVKMHPLDGRLNS